VYFYLSVEEKKKKRRTETRPVESIPVICCLKYLPRFNSPLTYFDTLSETERRDPSHRTNRRADTTHQHREMLRKRRSSLHFLKGSVLTTEDLAAIQVELAALDRRLLQLEQEEAANLEPSEGSYDMLMPQDYDSPEAQATLAHILGAELCQLAADGDAVAVERLLSKGVDPNSQDYDERTPLHLAALHGHIAVVMILLRFQAKATITDESGLTALDLAMKAKHQNVCEVLSIGGSGSPKLFTPVHDHMSIYTASAPSSCSDSVDELASRSAEGDDKTSDTSSGDCSDLEVEQKHPPAKPLTPVAGFAAARDRLARKDPEETMVIIMVGLPGRGKTFVAQNIQRYFSWHGVQCETLAHKNYWKKVTAGLATSAFDEGDPEEEAAALIAKDVRSAVRRNCGLVVIDGTHSTRRRRQCVQRAIEELHCVPAECIIFVEINNSDPALIAANVQRALEAAKNPPPSFVEDYYDLMRRHERIYQTLSRTHDRETCFIRIDDQQTFHLNRITGFRPTRMVFLLQNLRHSPVTLYFTRAGQYEEMGLRIGGDSALTELGDCYSKALFELMANDVGPESQLLVMSSSSKRCTQTIQHFYNMARHSISPLPEGGEDGTDPSALVEPPGAGGIEFPHTPVLSRAATPLPVPEMHGKRGLHLKCRVGIFPHLDDLNHGDCEGQLMSEVRRTLPNTLLSMEQDWYNVAWPNGESMRQIFTGRLENLIHELHSSSVPVLVCSHRPLIQGFRAYFTGEDGSMCDPQDAKNIDVPMHCVIKVSFRGACRVSEVIDLTHRTESIFKRRSGQDLLAASLSLPSSLVEANPSAEDKSNWT
jgi:broad specificity phosphatase PhoE